MRAEVTIESEVASRPLFTYCVLFGLLTIWTAYYLDRVVYAYYLDRVVYSGDREQRRYI